MNTDTSNTPTKQPANGLVGRVTDAGWRHVGEIGGVTLWQWQDDEMVRVATLDDDILRFIGAILNRRDEMTGEEQDQFIATYLFGGRSGMPSDEHQPAPEDSPPS